MGIPAVPVIAYPKFYMIGSIDKFYLQNNQLSDSMNSVEL